MNTWHRQPDENKSNPFYKNNNTQERKDWFSRTKPWNRVDSKIIDALINRFDEDPLFEVFVVTSMEHDLVPRYEQLNKQDYSEFLICSLISSILCEVGTHTAKKLLVHWFEDVHNSMGEVKRDFSTVMDTMETAILLDKNQIAAYAYLSIIHGLISKFEDGLKYAKQGISAIQAIKGSNVPFHLSDIDEIKNAGQSMDSLESMLKQLVQDYEKKL